MLSKEMVNDWRRRQMYSRDDNHLPGQPATFRVEWTRGIVVFLLMYLCLKCITHCIFKTFFGLQHPLETLVLHCLRIEKNLPRLHWLPWYLMAGATCSFWGFLVVKMWKWINQVCSCLVSSIHSSIEERTFWWKFNRLWLFFFLKLPLLTVFLRYTV